MNYTLIGEIAHAIRRLRGISLNTASETIDVCARTLARAERGEAPFDVNYLPPLAKCYGIEPTDFFYFNLKTKIFERPVANNDIQLKQEVEILRMQVRQLSEYIQLLQNGKDTRLELQTF